MSEVEARIQQIPIWNGPISWRPLSGGLSNESFTVTQDKGTGGQQTVVVRFGRDFPFHHVSREREIMVARAAYDAGFAPEVVYAELGSPGVMVSRYIEGKTLGAEDVRDHIEPIAKLMREFHLQMPQHVSGPGYFFWAFHVIRDYARILERAGSRMRGELPRYLEIARKLEEAQAPAAIVFGHHDLLPANFIHDGERLWLIDFEYAGFSTALFDLAGIASNAELDESQSLDLLRHYYGETPSDVQLRSHAGMQCASLLREAMWSMVSELYLDAPGVDYEAYTAENLERFEKRLATYRQKYGEVEST